MTNIENLQIKLLKKVLKMNNYDSKGFLELVKPGIIVRPLQAKDIQRQINYDKWKIDLNNKETESLIKEIKELRLKLAEMEGENHAN